MTPVELYILFVIVGLFLLAIEVFIPGGVLGAAGFASLLAACVTGFRAFPEPWGGISLIAILGISTVGLLLWLKIFPKTIVGKALTLNASAADFKTCKDFSYLLDTEGTAQTDLRPAGIVQINDHRIDVVAENGWIEKDSPIKVVAIAGTKISVRKI